VAIPVASRHISPAFPPLAILTGKMVVDVWTWASENAPAPIGLGVRATCIVVGTGLAACALTMMYMGTAPTFRGAITRNAALAAAVLPSSPLTVVSDRQTARAIQFYRGYRPTDTFATFETADWAALEDSAASRPGSVFSVVNGPIINEQTLNGSLYGGSITLTESERLAFERFDARAGEPVHSAHFEVSAFMVALLDRRIVQTLMGDRAARLERMLLQEDPALSGIRIFSDLGGASANSSP
jgi:hypothetical protein